MLFFIPFSLLIMVVLAASAITTVYYDVDQGADLPRFGTQNYMVLIVGVLVFTSIAAFIRKKKIRVPIYPALIFSAALCFFIIITVKGMAVTDGLTLDGVINAFNDGDYSSLEKGGYMFIYPFQIGYVAIGQFLSAVAGESNYFCYQILNLIAIILTIFFLYKMTYELFEDERVCDIFVLLSFLLFFFFTYVTYVYNDIWSVTPGVMALYYEILYLKRKKIRDEILAAVFLGFACMLKTNLYIALIAMVIILFADFADEILERRSRKGEKPRKTSRGSSGKKFLIAVLFAIILFASAIIPLKLIGQIYEEKAGLSEYPRGVPKSTYFAMAMQEGEGEWGWYNGFNRNTYEAAGYDYEIADEMAKQAIEERLSEFSDRPLHALRFYARKFLSQWADPTFVSLRNLELSMRHSDTDSSFARSLVYGKFSSIFQAVMDVEHFLVFLGLLVYCVLTIKNRSLTMVQALPVLFVFGGMLFHQLWEGSSRYIIRYFLTLMPLSAYGLEKLFRKIFRY